MAASKALTNGNLKWTIGILVAIVMAVVGVIGTTAVRAEMRALENRERIKANEVRGEGVAEDVAEIKETQREILRLLRTR